LPSQSTPSMPSPPSPSSFCTPLVAVMPRGKLPVQGAQDPRYLRAIHAILHSAAVEHLFVCVCVCVCVSVCVRVCVCFGGNSRINDITEREVHFKTMSQSIRPGCQRKKKSQQ